MPRAFDRSARGETGSRHLLKARTGCGDGGGERGRRRAVALPNAGSTSPESDTRTAAITATDTVAPVATASVTGVAQPLAPSREPRRGRAWTSVYAVISRRSDEPPATRSATSNTASPVASTTWRWARRRLRTHQRYQRPGPRVPDHVTAELAGEERRAGVALRRLARPWANGSPSRHATAAPPDEPGWSRATAPRN